VVHFIARKFVAAHQEANLMPATIPSAPPWTYLDVMAAILASVEGEKLKASTGTWHEAWRDIASASGKDLGLDRLSFEDRTPYPPFSDEVEAFMRVLSRSGVLSLGNPKFRYFTLEESAKAQIKDGNEELLQEHGSEIEQLARTLWERVGVTKQ
jgi:hypothetical protein